MNSEGQKFYKSQGQSFWWIKGKYEILADLLKKFCQNNLRPTLTDAKIIDIGSGPGNLAGILSPFADYFANDTSPEAILELKNRGLKIVEGDAAGSGLQVEADSFSLAVMVDSLEHMKDDLQCLREIFRVLRFRGKLVIMVPAHMSLWGAHDEKYGHFRRYELAELRDLLGKAGYKVEKISYIHALFYPFMYLWRKLKRYSGSTSDDFVRLPSLLNKILGDLVSLEKFFLRKFNSPFGTAIFAVAVKE